MRGAQRAVAWMVILFLANAPLNAQVDHRAEELLDLNEIRQYLWSTLENPYWEVVYDGRGSAADNVPNHLRWDSPFDDDWATPGGSSFSLDSPEFGLLSVDRVSNVLDHGKTGNIYRRDEFLSHEEGITLEIRVKIHENSNHNAFSITYFDDKAGLGIHLSPEKISYGDLSAAVSNHQSFPYSFTNQFRVIRFVKLPGSFDFDIFSPSLVHQP